MTNLLVGVLFGLVGFVVLGLLMLAAFLWGKHQSKPGAKTEEAASNVSKQQSRIPTTVTTVPRGGIAQTKFSVSSRARGDSKKPD